jgi:hypothetical protein
MAIIQISKIQQRSGNLVDLPQLDEAQLGWANDAKRLFIGASNVALTDVENVEVLTSYSTISFSQIDGSAGSNVNITSVQPGQILAYDVNLNSWVNTGGNASSPGNASQYAGGPIHLGDVSDVKIGGGSTGYVLETDGQGNINWTSKGTLYTKIINLVPDLGNANIIVMTVANTTPYTNTTKITISGANGTANANVNSQSFYIKVANDYPTSGNVLLYTDSSLTTPANGTGLTYTNSPNAISTSATGSGIPTPGGSVNTIQFNESGILNGSANFIITGGNTVLLNGGFTANTVAGSLTTASQPNITTVGTLNGLVVGGDIIPNANVTYNLGNNTARFKDLYLAGNTIFLGTQTISANASSVIISGQLVANLVGNISGRAATAGTVTTNAQPNITSVGILNSLSVIGNANVGNLNTNGNINGYNLNTTGEITTLGGIKTDNYFYANGYPFGGYGNSNVELFLPTVNNYIGGGSALFNGYVLTTGLDTNPGTIIGNWSLAGASRLNATYADLAEYYEADQHYSPGTVLEFGGDKEVTIAEDGTTRVAGVVSTNPAYAMNANCKGIATLVALQGRVPAKVRGVIHKGDMMISAGNGYARPGNNPQMGSVIGKALENFSGTEGVIEIAIGRL